MSYRQAIKIDKKNRVNLWQDVFKLELDSMAAYEGFKDLGHKAAPSPRYKTN